MCVCVFVLSRVFLRTIFTVRMVVIALGQDVTVVYYREPCVPLALHHFGVR